MGRPRALAALLLLLGLCSARALRFADSGRLLVLQATDLHFGEDRDSDAATTEVRQPQAEVW